MKKQNNLRFTSLLSRWYNQHKRDLPWRHTKDPYLIWLSEVILQQTRVDQGLPYFNKFIEAYPTVELLAQANETDVLKLWQGLGYYSRARNLHTTAKIIATDYKGVFPKTYADVFKLKGVGEYTAAAIASFAYNMPYAVVDGNVYRVLSRIFAIDDPINSLKGKKLFSELAKELLDEDEPGLYNQAIMELGALQCVPTSPNCALCPVSALCLAYAKSNVASYPVKEKKQKVKERYFNYLDIRTAHNAFLHRREKSDIWRHLYEFPLIESDVQLSFADLQQHSHFRQIFGEANDGIVIKQTAKFKHILSHQVIYATFYTIEVEQIDVSYYLKVADQELHKYPVSRLTQKYLEKLSDSKMY